MTYDEFGLDQLYEAESGGLLQAEAFYNLYSRAAIDSGDVDDIEYCQVIGEGKTKYKVDGYSINHESGELTLAVCDFRTDREIQSLNNAAAQTLFSRAVVFFENSLDADFINSLEESSPAFQLAHTIYQGQSAISRIRVVVFSNAKVSIRKALVSAEDRAGYLFSYSILDFERYSNILSSKGGNDPIEIDLAELGLAPFKCLDASSDSSDYKSYLVVVPAKSLATVYSLYKARLLESNVRTFLQARTKVNKGIQATLKDEPSNFFAYNNGLTATASAIKTAENGRGISITSITNFQIVNGGQTTASILYAQDKAKSTLENAYVQMKLTVIDGDVLDEFVPNIAKYANSQNAINAADLFSSHPFHLQMEKMSRRISAPAKEGAFVGAKWFYERARGQYNDSQAYMSPSERKKFLSEYPKHQKVVKTDLAKYEMTFLQKPNVVSKGAQKCFDEFASQIDKKWDEHSLNYGDGYFMDAMARANIFRTVDKAIGTSDWYKTDRGYKAQIVTYTISLVVELLHRHNVVIDFRLIWKSSGMSPTLEMLFESIAPKVTQVIKDTPSNISNVGEYCKTELCWNNMLSHFQKSFVDPAKVDGLISKSKEKNRKKKDKDEREIDSGIDIQVNVLELGAAHWIKVLELCWQESVASPRDLKAIERCCQIASGVVPTEHQCKTAMAVYLKLKNEGHSFQ